MDKSAYDIGSRVIVVGIDGSANAECALAWAVDEASRHGGRLRVLSAWHKAHARPGSVALYEERQARQAIQSALEAVPHATVDVTTEVVEGSASAALVDAAVGADLLVVGSLGIQAGRRTVLGSVSALCALHADCPVVVVPAGWRPADGRDAGCLSGQLLR